MPIPKHKRTVEMTENIKEAQRSKKFSDEEVADHLGIKTSDYKNIIRALPQKGDRFVKDTIINGLADLYDCSTDYILGLSNDMSCDQNGRTITRPFTFNIEKKQELFKYLNDDFKTLNDLHFLLCQHASEYRKDYTENLHFYTDTIRKSRLLELLKNYSAEDYNLLIENTLNYGEEYSTCVSDLCQANLLFKNKNYESALKTYLNIIYNTITKSNILSPIADKATEKILILSQIWDEFPESLNIIIKALPQIKKYRFFIKGYSNHELLDIAKDSNSCEVPCLSEQIINTIKQYIN